MSDLSLNVRKSATLGGRSRLWGHVGAAPAMRADTRSPLNGLPISDAFFCPWKS